MKKIKVFLLCAFMLTTTVGFVQAQMEERDPLAPKIGVKGGINLANLYVDDASDENLKVGLNAGLFFKVPFTEFFAIQPEILYSSKGSKVTYDNWILGEGEYRFNLNYIEVPVLAVFNIGPHFNLHAGPYAAFLASANIKDMRDDGTIADANDLNADNFNRFDYGLAGGAALEFSNFTIGARYNYGLKEIGKSGNLSGELVRDSKNSVASFYIGFGF
jgi:Outer membrane protein beta-barrel domain